MFCFSTGAYSQLKQTNNNTDNSHAHKYLLANNSNTENTHMYTHMRYVHGLTHCQYNSLKRWYFTYDFKDGPVFDDLTLQGRLFQTDSAS